MSVSCGGGCMVAGVAAVATVAGVVAAVEITGGGCDGGCGRGGGGGSDRPGRRLALKNFT